MSQPENDIAPIEVELIRLAPGHYTSAGFTVPFAGDWKLTVKAVLGDVDEASATADRPHPLVATPRDRSIMIRKLAMVGAIVTGVVALMAGPAFAHVEIEREGDVSHDGSWSRRPSRCRTSETTRATMTIELVFPASPEAHDARRPRTSNGWTATVQEGRRRRRHADHLDRRADRPARTRSSCPLTIGDVPDDVDDGRLQGGPDLRRRRRRPLDRADTGGRRGAGAPGAGADRHAARHRRSTTRPTDGAATTQHSDSDSHDDGMSTGAIVAIVVVGVVIVIALVVFLVISRSRRLEDGTAQRLIGHGAARST